MINEFETLLKSFLSQSFKGVCVDSRFVGEKAIFFALPGAKTHGHAFLSEAASKGAVAAVVETNYRGEDFGLELFRVDDVMGALQNLAKKILSRRKTKIIALTGSFGKTTTKDFMTTLLKAKFKVASSPGNSNSQIGLPLAILNSTDGTEDILVLEMGMTHPGNLRSLVHIAPPDIALLTSVALVHAVNFETLDDICRAKAEIFSHANTSLGIFHHDIPISEEIRREGSCEKHTFSTVSKGADYFLEKKFGKLHVYEDGREVAMMPPLPVVGDHNEHNFLAAAAAARSLKMSWEEILANQQFLRLPERRLQFVEKNDVLFVNDSYNASELTVKAALRSMPQPKDGARKIAVIGEMLELGKFSENCHLEVGKYALDYVEQMFCLGPLCAPIHDCWKKAGRPVVWENERELLVERLRSILRPGDVVLLKASRSKQLWKILEEI